MTQKERVLTPEQLLAQIRIILVEPQGPMNVGAVCRAMKNFGLRNLVLVRPGCELGLEAVKMALHARDILEHARIVQSVPEAIEGSVIALGTSNRFGEYHEPNVSLQHGIQNIDRVIPHGPVSIVFGREEWGLTKDDLQYLQGAIHIVTDPAFSSMNLAQAVLLVAYELYQAFGRKSRRVSPHEGNPYEQPPTVDELARLYAHMKSALNKCEFLPRSNPDGLFQVIRAFIGRSKAKRREINILMGMFSNIDGFFKKYVPTTDDGEKGPSTENTESTEKAKKARSTENTKSTEKAKKARSTENTESTEKAKSAKKRKSMGISPMKSSLKSSPGKLGKPTKLKR
jgi:TrmH family RNA methyltransferase